MRRGVPIKAVILAGGFGTRISEETHLRPKPMVEIGGMPIIWHIMKHYSHHGINEFVICLGYKGYMIKEFFSNYALHSSDVTLNLATGQTSIHSNNSEPWKITLVDSGEDSQTGRRLQKVAEYVKGEDFCFTYGDGVSNVNILKLVEAHKASHNSVTMTAIRPPSRYGAIKLENDKVIHFSEKPKSGEEYINGGFFVVSPSALNYLSSENQSWEADVLPKIAEAGSLGAFKHDGFWQSMDTLRDKNLLEELWQQSNPPWKTWL
jgi:glucose-1-phosphate cytidylyltransferase